jgi:N-acetylglucosaminyldiphosphoundecaprenol N-acetyl-beta-D-mannosaminyltransferase
MTDTDQIPSFQVLGVRVHLVQMGQVLSAIENWIDQHSDCRYIVATQMHGIMEARRDAHFKEILNSSGLFVPDGFSLIWAARLSGFKLKSRVPGPELFLEGCRLAAKRGYRVFFYGDTEETLEALTLSLKDRVPGLKVAGAHSPPFRPLTEDEDVQETKMINDSGADIVWVGLGLPKQERWMFEHRNKLDAPVLVGVGAAFKFTSGQVKRAPPWVGNHGFEWLWRFVQEPGRVWHRVMIDGPHFLLCVVIERLDLKKRSNRQ